MTRAFAVILTCLVVLASPAAALADGWSQRAAMDEGRSDLQAAAIGTEIYVGGGGGIVGPSNSFASYDSVSDFWQGLAPLPVPLESFGMTALEGRIYVAGGLTKTDHFGPINRAWVYEPGARLWRELASLPGRRAEHALVATESGLLVVGGSGDDVTAVWRYDPQADKWSVASYRLPVARQKLAAVAHGNEVYVVGGLADGSSISRVDILNTSNGQWRRGADMPHALAGHTAAFLSDGRLHVTGGMTGARQLSSGDHFIYDRSANTWRKGPGLPTPRHGLASAVADGRWYVIGGGAGAGLFALFTQTDVVERYETGGG